MSIRIGNKEYVTVSERVTAAHADEGFSMVSEEVVSIGNRHFVRITIEVKGRHYIGSAEIKFDARVGSPDANNPYECAQTSALGRCLGFCGYGSVESIASADEIVRSQAPVQPPASAQQKESIGKLCQHLGKPEPENAETMSYASAKELIATLSAEYRQSRAAQSGK